MNNQFICYIQDIFKFTKIIPLTYNQNTKRAGIDLNKKKTIFGLRI